MKNVMYLKTDPLPLHQQDISTRFIHKKETLARVFTSPKTVLNKKNQPKNYMFGAVRSCNENKKSKPLKGISESYTKSTYQVSTSCEERTQNIRKHTPKKTNFQDCEGVQKVETSKRHIYWSYQVFIPNFYFLSPLGEKIEEESLKVKK